MPAYRLYFLDGAGRVDTAEWLDAADDDAASIDAAKLLTKGVYAELWQGQRLVQRLNPNGTTWDAAG